jgi:hypothetical protein
MTSPITHIKSLISRGRPVCRWHDLHATISILPETSNLVTAWPHFTPEQKAAKATEMIAPWFVLGDVIKRTRIISPAKAKTLLQDRRVEFSRFMMGIDNEVDGEIHAVACGYAGVLTFLMACAEQGTKGDTPSKHGRISRFTDKLKGLCASRFAMVPEVIADLDARSRPRVWFAVNPSLSIPINKDGDNRADPVG